MCALMLLGDPHTIVAHADDGASHLVLPPQRVTTPPGAGVNLKALSSKMLTTRRSATGSPSTRKSASQDSFAELQAPDACDCAPARGNFLQRLRRSSGWIFRDWLP